MKTKRIIILILASAIGVIFLSTLLVLGNNAEAPSAESNGVNSSPDKSAFPEGASDPNYTVLCINKKNVKIRFTKTGSYATCPTDFATVPVKLDPKLIKK